MSAIEAVIGGLGIEEDVGYDHLPGRGARSNVYSTGESSHNKRSSIPLC